MPPAPAERGLSRQEVVSALSLFRRFTDQAHERLRFARYGVGSSVHSKQGGAAGGGGDLGARALFLRRRPLGDVGGDGGGGEGDVGGGGGNAHAPQGERSRCVRVLHFLQGTAG